MATRALLPYIQGTSRVQPQPRKETERERTYRETMQDIAATLNVIGGAVNIGRAVEPWVAGIGYEGAPTTAIDAEASRINANLAAAYPQTTPTQPGAQQVPQAAPERRGAEPAPSDRMPPSMMNREDRRGAIMGLGQPGPQATATGVRFNRIGGERQEPMLVRNDQQALMQGAPLFRQDGVVTTPTPSQEVNATGLPQQTAYAGQKPSLAGFEERLASTSFPTEQQMVQEAEAAHSQREAARAGMWQSAANAAEQTAERDAIAAGMDSEIAKLDKEQATFDAISAAVPPPPPADPVQRQAELQAIASESLAPAAQAALEIDKFAAVPTFQTYAEAVSAMRQAVLSGDIAKAQEIMQGAARSPLVDLRPTTFADRLSGAHVHRAMTQLGNMASGMNAAAMRAAQAQQRAGLAERRLMMQERNTESMIQNRLKQQEVAQMKLAQAEQKMNQQWEGLKSQIKSRELRDILLKDFQPAKIAATRAAANMRNAFATQARRLLPAREVRGAVQAFDDYAGMVRDWEIAKAEGRAVGSEPPRVEQGRVVYESKEVPTPGAAKTELQVEAAAKKDQQRRSQETAQLATQELLGLGTKRGRGGSGTPQVPPEVKNQLQVFDRQLARIAQAREFGQLDTQGFRKALPALKKQVEQMPLEFRAANEQALRAEAERFGVPYDPPAKPRAKKGTKRKPAGGGF